MEEGTQRMGAGCGKWGRGCERIGCKGEVGALGSVKDGESGEKGVLRCVEGGGMDAKNGSGAWQVGAMV